MPYVITHDGQVIETYSPWLVARNAGLSRRDYGRTWFVWESMDDYRDSLD